LAVWEADNPERVASLLHFYLSRIMPDKDADTATIQLFTQCFALKKHKCGRHLIDDSLSLEFGHLKVKIE